MAALRLLHNLGIDKPRQESVYRNLDLLCVEDIRSAFRIFKRIVTTGIFTFCRNLNGAVLVREALPLKVPFDFLQSA